VADPGPFVDRPLPPDPGERGLSDAERAASTALRRERELVDELLGRLATALRSANGGASSARSTWHALVNGDESDW
jgi:hypothetical protein